MTAENTETRTVRRGDGTLAVRITYTPRTGVPVRLYRLKLEVVEEETSGCSPYVFVYQRAAFGKPMEDGSPRDEFVCVADELDEDEPEEGFEFGDENSTIYEVECACGEIIDFDEEVLEKGSIVCPNCGETLEFSLEDEE